MYTKLHLGVGSPFGGDLADSDAPCTPACDAFSAPPPAPQPGDARDTVAGSRVDLRRP
jgi:hypothetical protein